MFPLIHHLPDTGGTANKGLCLVDSVNNLVVFVTTFDPFDNTRVITGHGWIVTHISFICEEKPNNDTQEIK